MKYVAATVTETAFNCPYCRVLTSQRWSRIYGRVIESKSQLPRILDSSDDHGWENIENEKDRQKIINMVKRALIGRPFFDSSDTDLYAKEMTNCFASVCFECNDISIWLRDRLIYPEVSDGPLANPDMPDEIRLDYEEASAILARSPRAAAALMRLCIQKLMVHLELKGENINEDIKALVSQGLDPRIQKALDAVRVIGNNAVHPGTMDLRDDRATAESLFRLLNVVVDRLISVPKHIDDVYATLPPGALAAIEKRDAKKGG